MTSPNIPDAWLRGPIEGVPDLLQPVAHALVQAREEARRLMLKFPAERLWERPAGLASAGFHLQHIAGVVDRLFTYARGEPLSTQQQEVLAREGQPDSGITVDELLSTFDGQVDRALNQLRTMQPHTLTNARVVGRKQMPSTVQGLLFHAAEHVQRHLGQLLVTARVGRQSDRAVPILPAGDLEVAKRFYASKLGFHVLFEVSDDGRTGLLGVARGTIRITLDCPMDGHGRNACVALEVDDADAYFAEWSQNVDALRPPKDEAWGARTFDLLDPFGNTLFVIGPPAA